MNADLLEEKNHGDQKIGKQQIYNAERKKITLPIQNSVSSENILQEWKWNKNIFK